MTTTSVAPAPCDLIEGVARSVALLRKSAPGGESGTWAPEERGTAITQLDSLITDLTLYRGQVLLAHRDAGRWGSVQDRDFTDWRSRETGAGRGPATGEVQLAESLGAMPALARAVERGELGLEHAKTLGRLHRTASQEVKQALDAGGLDRLVERAAREQLTAPELGKQVKSWAAQVDAAAAQEEFDAVRRRRSLTMRNHAGGVAGEFFLDPVAGAELRTALEAITGRPAADDARTREQRMADALSTMAGRTLQVGADLTGAQVRPHLALLVREETWVGIAARRRAFESCPSGPRPPWPDVAPGELEDGTIVPLGELERLMCDSELTRMVMDAAGIPLDVGRTQRTYTKELRRAVVTRDRHCQWPGCRMRASWSEVHHITWFSRGGITSIDEGICLCSYHHHLVHQVDAQVTVLSDGFDFHYPDGTHIGTTRRRSTSDEPLLPDPAVACRATDTGDRSQLTLRQAGPQVRGEPPAPLHGLGDLAPRRPAPIETIGPAPPAKTTGRGAASTARPLPARPSSYATAPATLWDPDPPF